MDEFGYKSRLYNIWCHIKSRCNNKNDKYYGSRGICVCEEWAKSYESFKTWALSNNYKNDLEIDRIDVNGNYEPSNCRWISRKAQMNNTRNSHYLEFNNQIHTIAEWCELCNIPYNCLKQRINKQKWSIEKALTHPVRQFILSNYGEGIERKGKIFYIEYNGIIKTSLEWSKILNVNPSSFNRRINKGWSAKKCIETPFKNH